MGLPKVAGEDVLCEIRADPRLAQTQVVVVTAYSIVSDAVHAAADCVLAKPIGYVQLRDLVARIAGGNAGVPGRTS